MFLLYETNGDIHRFDSVEEIREYIEMRHAQEGGFEWVSQIRDEHGKHYGCSWSLRVEKIE